jgi:hypothetical protein
VGERCNSRNSATGPKGGVSRSKGGVGGDVTGEGGGGCAEAGGCEGLEAGASEAAGFFALHRALIEP